MNITLSKSSYTKALWINIGGSYKRNTDWILRIWVVLQLPFIQIALLCISRAQNSSRVLRSMGRCMYCLNQGGMDCCRETSSETCSHSQGWTPAAAGLTCVNEGVLLHIRFLVEPLPTVLAWIGPCVRVDEQVGGQSRRSLKTLATNLTIKAAFLQREEPKHTRYIPPTHQSCPFCLSKHFHFSRELDWPAEMLTPMLTRC